MSQAAAAKGFDALILTDADVLQVEYGLPFLRNIFSFSSEQSALLSENALDDYLTEIQRVSKASVEWLRGVLGIDTRSA